MIKSTVLFLPILVALVLDARPASGLVIYRIGTPFAAAEKDSLEGLGIDYREIGWSLSQLQQALEPDSLEAGSLQPNFLDVDEDIAATLVERGGKIWIKDLANEDRLQGLPMLDQDSTTDKVFRAIAPESFLGRTINQKITFDLGGRFLIREIRFRPLADRPDHFLESFNIGIADLGFDVYRIPIFTPLVEVRENTEPEVRLVLNTPVTTEAMQLLIHRITAKEIGIADFELLGGGYVSDAAYESDVIELDDIASLGEIRWSGRQDPHARVAIRTRAGLDPHPDIFWESRPERQDSVRFLQGGGDLSLTEYTSEYNRLPALLKPLDERDRVSADTENWSFWSSPYPFENPGVATVSPGPRKFVQIKVDFSSNIENGGKIDYVEFKASSPPLVRELLGEIYPIETEVGKATRFTYYISPTIRSTDISFDAVEISTPSGVESVDSLRIARIDQPDFSWTINEDGLGFEVQLSRRLESTDSGALVEVVFTAPVLREVGTSFEGRAFDTTKPHEVRQRVVPGDATNEVESERLAVRTSLSNSLVYLPQISPNPFTPNGDGVNDIVNISYKLLRVTSAVPVSIEIFDLSGKLVRRVYDGDNPLGDYSHTWDGRDHSNGIVPPGLYLYWIVADVQSKRETNSGIVSVAY